MFHEIIKISNIGYKYIEYDKKKIDMVAKLLPILAEISRDFSAQSINLLRFFDRSVHNTTDAKKIDKDIEKMVIPFGLPVCSARWENFDKDKGRYVYIQNDAIPLRKKYLETLKNNINQHFLGPALVVMVVDYVTDTSDAKFLQEAEKPI